MALTREKDHDKAESSTQGGQGRQEELENMAPVVVGNMAPKSPEVVDTRVRELNKTEGSSRDVEESMPEEFDDIITIDNRTMLLVLVDSMFHSLTIAMSSRSIRELRRVTGLIGNHLRLMENIVKGPDNPEFRNIPAAAAVPSPKFAEAESIIIGKSSQPRKSRRMITEARGIAKERRDKSLPNLVKGGDNREFQNIAAVGVNSPKVAEAESIIISESSQLRNPRIMATEAHRISKEPRDKSLLSKKMRLKRTREANEKIEAAWKTHIKLTEDLFAIYGKPLEVERRLEETRVIEKEVRFPELEDRGSRRIWNDMVYEGEFEEGETGV